MDIALVWGYSRNRLNWDRLYYVALRLPGISKTKPLVHVICGCARICTQMGHSPKFDRHKRARIQALLLSAIDSAKAEYRASKEAYDRAKEYKADLGLDHPDGMTVLSRALTNYSESLERYREAVTAFNRFVLCGKIPHDLE